MSVLNFDNTQTAFAAKSNFELMRDYQVFRLINQPWLVNFGTKTASRMLDAGLSAPIVLGMRPTIYAVFCGGDTLEEATPRIEKLYAHGVTSILDYGVEGKEDEADFERTARNVKAAIDYARQHQAVDIVSSKFTGLIKFSILEKMHAKEKLSEVEQESYDRSINRIESICAHAAENGVSLFVDAEESWIQEPLDELTYVLMKKYNREKPIIYNTAQFYRKDRLAFLKQAAERAKVDGVIYAVKLVRGAYMEKETLRAQVMGYENPIQDSKADTDRDYDEALRYSIANIGHMAICVATHNEASTLLATKLMADNQLPNNHPHVCFSQLLGMSDNITFNLAGAGYNAGKYMPYGPVKDVIPYLIRRAQENTSVSGQMGRELKLLKNEVKRRRLFVL